MYALYFNLDLTLTRMRRGFAELPADALADVGVPDDEVDPGEFSELFFGYFAALEPEPRRRAFADYFDRRGVDADPVAATDRWEELELAAVEPAVPELRAVLSALADEFRLGVLTSGTVELQRAKLEKLGVVDLFDDVCISYGAGATKDGGLFARAAERTPADGYAYASTSASDIEAARNAGWETVERELAELREDPVGIVARETGFEAG